MKKEYEPKRMLSCLVSVEVMNRLEKIAQKRKMTKTATLSKIIMEAKLDDLS